MNKGSSTCYIRSNRKEIYVCHCPILLCTGVASPQVLGEVLGTTISERYKAIRDCPKDGYEDGNEPRENHRRSD